MLRIGRLRIPLSRPPVELRRKSQPFWKILGEQGIGCTILRVPITFPPEKFDGTPALRHVYAGSQGHAGQLLAVHHARRKGDLRKWQPLSAAARGGRLRGRDRRPRGHIPRERPPLRIPFRIAPRQARSNCESQGRRIAARAGRIHRIGSGSPFRTAIGAKAAGMARFLLTETEPEFSLYMTPIKIDPERPALPISHPPYYAAYLANLLGSYATVGMAEDTWALNEGVIDEDAFLRQAWDIFAEREAMFLHCAGEYAPRRGGLRLRYQRPHAAHVLSPSRERAHPHADVIEDMYQRMDALVGKAHGRRR